MKNENLIACENLSAALAVLGFESSIRELADGGGFTPVSRFYVVFGSNLIADLDFVSNLAGRAGFETLRQSAPSGIACIPRAAARRRDRLAFVKAEAVADALAAVFSPVMPDDVEIVAVVPAGETEPALKLVERLTFDGVGVEGSLGDVALFIFDCLNETLEPNDLLQGLQDHLIGESSQSSARS